MGHHSHVGSTKTRGVEGRMETVVRDQMDSVHFGEIIIRKCLDVGTDCD